MKELNQKLAQIQTELKANRSVNTILEKPKTF